MLPTFMAGSCSSIRFEHAGSERVEVAAVWTWPARGSLRPLRSALGWRKTLEDHKQGP